MPAQEPIHAGIPLPAAGVPTDAPTFDYASLIGRRVTLHGSGENAEFEERLPRPAVVVRQLALDDWGPDWLLLRFDESFRYEHACVRECLVRARWWGTPIGSESAPVFVLTDPRGALTTEVRWAAADFDFVTWGRVTV